jgi:hypothetical protein
MRDQIQKYLLPVLAANLMLFFGMLTGGRLYLDDLGRSMLGNSDWSLVGRPLADLFIGLINLGTPLVNTFPLPQLIAIGIVSVASIFLGARYRLGSPLLALCTLPLAGQPYFLENMSFTFDSPAMALSLLLAVAAAAQLQETGRGPLVRGGLMVLAALALYQAAVEALVVAYLFLLVANIDPDLEPQRYFLPRLGRFCLATGAAFLIYLPVPRIFPLSDYGRQNAGMGGLDTAGANFTSYFSTLGKDWGGNALGYIMLLLVILTLVAVFLKPSAGQDGEVRRTGRSLVYGTLSVALVLLALLLSYFPLLLLQQPTLTPRTFIGFGVFLACCSLQTCSYFSARTGYPDWCRWGLGVVPAFLIAFACINFAYAYSKGSTEQKAYEEAIVNRLIADTDNVLAGRSIASYSIAGNIGRNPLLINSIDKYPLLYRMVQIHIDEDRYWGYLQLNYLGLVLPKQVLAPERKQAILATQPVLKRPKYWIHLLDNQMVIRFIPS